MRLRSHGINKNNDTFENVDMAYDHGKLNPWYYEMQELGFNYRITDIQCALGTSQMKRLDHFIERRGMLALRYDDAFESVPCISIPLRSFRRLSANHLYVLHLDFKEIGSSRREFIESLRARGIGSQVHYIPVPLQPYYEHLGACVDDYENCMYHYKRALSIPLYPDLVSEEQERVISVLRDLVE